MQFTITDLWHHMGMFARLIVFVLGLMSVASLVVAAERVIVFSKSRGDSKTFAQKMAAILAKGDLQAASTANVGKKVGHLGRVIGAGLAAYRISTVGPKEATVESVARALERQAQREVQSLKRGLNLLATVGSTAPFVGLLGTVMGIGDDRVRIAGRDSRGDALQLPPGLGRCPRRRYLGVLERVPRCRGETVGRFALATPSRPTDLERT